MRLAYATACLGKMLLMLMLLVQMLVLVLVLVLLMLLVRILLLVRMLVRMLVQMLLRCPAGKCTLLHQRLGQLLWSLWYSRHCLTRVRLPMYRPHGSYDLPPMRLLHGRRDGIYMGLWCDSRAGGSVGWGSMGRGSLGRQGRGWSPAWPRAAMPKRGGCGGRGG